MALRLLGGFRAWSIDIGDNGEQILKDIGFGCDVDRTKKRRGYRHSEYGLLCWTEGGTLSTFEILKAECIRAMDMKTANCIDRFGQEIDVNYDLDATFWDGKAMYILAGRRSDSGRWRRIVYILYVACIEVIFLFLVAYMHVARSQKGLAI